MPWYKSGTVSVSNGQTSVTGTDTKFATNARVGDGFRGPDGEWYEVLNIASETVIAIYPAYAGATASNSSNYMIAPLQGYNKETADRLRAITDGVAAVSSVNSKTGQVVLSKSDIGLANVDNTSDVNKPISTAVADALTARTPTSSNLDTTTGRLIKVGDYGENGGNPILLTRGINANDLTVPGTYIFNDGGVNIPTTYCYLKHIQHTTNYSKQIAYGLTTDLVYDRAQVNGTWQPWSQAVKAGANSTITSLTGLTTALSISQGGTGNTTGTATKLAPSAILGSVSQASGVPTGSIVERGSNSSGEYVKFADGTLMCWMNPTGNPSINANTFSAYGPYSTPVSFVNNAFYVHAVIVPNGTNDMYGVITAYALSNNTVGFVFRNGATAQTFGNTKFFCFGRWF